MMAASALLAIVIAVSATAIAPPVAGQPPSGASDPKTAVVGYIDNVIRPVLTQKTATEDRLRAFYRTNLSDRTRIRVNEEQFVAFWRQIVKRLAGVFVRVDLELTAGEPVESESLDQALVPITGRASMRGTTIPLAAILGCVSPLRLERVWTMACSSEFPRSISEDKSFFALYLVAREGESWKVVLHQNLVREMQKLDLSLATRRYDVDVTAMQQGLTLHIWAVTLTTAGAELRLSIENATEAEASLYNALVLAKLVDDRGKAHIVRILRSAIPETAPMRSTVDATLLFEGVPLDASRLQLTIDGVGFGGRTVRLSANVALLPYARTSGTPIPGEPVYLFLLTTFQWPFRAERTLRAMYRTQLTRATREHVTEGEFIAFYRSGAIIRSVCRPTVPDGFSLGSPAYNLAKDRASISVVSRHRSRTPGSSDASYFTWTFDVVKEGPRWKLVLPEEAVADIKNPGPPITALRYMVEDTQQDAGLEITVHDVVLDANSTHVRLTVRNENDFKIAFGVPFPWSLLISLPSRTHISDPQGKQYRLRAGLSPFGLEAGGSDTWELDFEPIPPGSRKIRLELSYWDSQNADPQRTSSSAEMDINLARYLCPEIIR